MQRACLKKADEKKQFFNKIHEFQMYFDSLCSRIQRREKIKNILEIVSESLKKAPYDYKQIIELNISVQNKVIGSLRALFYMNVDFKSEFISRFEAEISEGSIADYRAFLDNLKKIKIDYYALGLMTPKDFFNLFGFSNPLIKSKATMNNSKLPSFKPHLTTLGTHHEVINNSQIADSYSQHSNYRINKANSVWKKRTFSRDQNGYARESSQESDTRKMSSSRMFSMKKNSQKFNESMESSKIRVVSEKPEQIVQRNPFFYKLKQKANQPSITIKEGHETETISKVPDNKPQNINFNSLTNKSQASQLSPEAKKRQQFYRAKNRDNEVRTPSKSLLSRSNLDDSLSHSAYRRSPNRKPRTNILDESNVKVNYKIYSLLEGYNTDVIQFLTGQIIVHIFLEYLTTSGHQMFDSLISTYTSLEEEVNSKFADYYYLKHLSIIKGSFLRKLLKETPETGLFSLIKCESEDEGYTSEFYHQKLQKVTKISNENSKLIDRINGFHQIIIKATDCAANLPKVNKLDYQIMIIDKIAAEKKMLNEKTLVMHEIEKLETDLESAKLVCQLPSKGNSSSLSPSRINIPKRVCCQIVEQISLYETFIDKSVFNTCQENCAFELLEFDKQIQNRIILQIDLNCQIFQKKIHVLHKFLTSLDRIFNPQTRLGVNVTSINPRKYREKLFFNINRYSDAEHIMNNRRRKEKFATIMKGAESLDLTRSFNDHHSSSSQSKENINNLGLRFLRNTAQDNEFVRTHFQGFFKEQKKDRPISTRRSTLSKNRVINRIDQNLKIMNHEMNLTFQMLQRLKDGKLIRPNQDYAEEDQVA